MSGRLFRIGSKNVALVFLLVITLPCTDFSTAGKRRGSFGDTGWMFVEAVRRVLQMTKRPTIVEIETADGIIGTNGGQELAEAKKLLEEFYVVKVRKITVADHGSISHRKRMVMVCIDREFAGADDFEMPEPTWGTGTRVACARDMAVSDELALATLDKRHVYPGRLATRCDVQGGRPMEQPPAHHGIMMKLGRIAPGMGHSSRPHLGLYWDGAPNGPTGYGGGGIWPPQDFEWGGRIEWLRRFCSYEYYNIAGLSRTFRDWHATYTPSEDALIQGVNQGFPTAVTFAIDTVLGEILKKHGAVMDMPMGASAPNTYVTGKLWAPEQNGARAGRAVQSEPPSQRLWARAVQPMHMADTMPDLQDESDDEEIGSPAPN